MKKIFIPLLFAVVLLSGCNGQQGNGTSNECQEDKQATKLTAVQTPDGNPAYKEVKIILECRLAEVTTVAPEDFYNDEDRKFVTDAHAETGDWHKLVLSQITKAWARK